MTDPKPVTGQRTTRQRAAIADLLTLTGRQGEPGNGLLISHPHANLQGLLDMAVTPEPAAVAPDLSVKAAEYKGAHTLHELEELVKEGRIKGVFLLGENPLEGTALHKKLGKAAFIVAMDVLETATTRKADVVLPATPLPETDGSVTSFDRKVQAFERVFNPLSGFLGREILELLLHEATGSRHVDLLELRIKMAGLNHRYQPLPKLEAGKSFVWGVSAEGEALKTPRVRCHGEPGYKTAKPDFKPALHANEGWFETKLRPNLKGGLAHSEE